MVARIPARGVRTIDPLATRLLPYLCLAGLGFFAAGEVLRRRPARGNPSGASGAPDPRAPEPRP